eukprot:g71451.t1
MHAYASQLKLEKIPGVNQWRELSQNGSKTALNCISISRKFFRPQIPRMAVQHCSVRSSILLCFRSTACSYLHQMSSTIARENFDSLRLFREFRQEAGMGCVTYLENRRKWPQTSISQAIALGTVQ